MGQCIKGKMHYLNPYNVTLDNHVHYKKIKGYPFPDSLLHSMG